MKAQVLRGPKQQIAASVARISGEVREAVVFVEEPSDPVQKVAGDDIFAEVNPFAVKAVGADYSGETLYTRMEGE